MRHTLLTPPTPNPLTLALNLLTFPAPHLDLCREKVDEKLAVATNIKLWGSKLQNTSLSRKIKPGPKTVAEMKWCDQNQFSKAHHLTPFTLPLLS